MYEKINNVKITLNNVGWPTKAYISAICIYKCQV